MYRTAHDPIAIAADISDRYRDWVAATTPADRAELDAAIRASLRQIAQWVDDTTHGVAQ